MKKGFLNHLNKDVSKQITPKKSTPCAALQSNNNPTDFTVDNTLIADSKCTPCAICMKLTKLACAECKKVSYCSKECRRADYPVHHKICTRFAKPYTFHQPSRIFKNAVFRVEDFFRGPDQPMDPPDTEDFEDVQMLWR